MNKISTKFSVIVLLAIITFSSIGALNLIRFAHATHSSQISLYISHLRSEQRIEEQVLRDKLHRKAVHMAEFLARNSFRYIQYYDYENLVQLAKDAEKDPDISFVEFDDADGNHLFGNEHGIPGDIQLPIVQEGLVMGHLEMGLDYSSVDQAVGNISKRIDEVVRTIEENNQHSTKELVRRIILSIFFGVTILYLIIYFIFSKVIETPLRRAKDIANAVANGDLDQDIAVTSNDELGQLTQSMKVMVTSLKEGMMMKEAKEAAQAASQAKSEFLANMSHEIRTPMNAIIGLAELALKNEMSAKLRDYLTKIMMSSHSLLNLINGILDFSKIEAGKLELESVEFQLHDILENIADMMSNSVAEKDIELFFVVSPDVPCALIGDPLRLGQVLLNLVSNGVKFTEKGEVSVKVSLQEKDEKKARLLFEVEDTGIGLSNEEAARLFKSFSQADGSTTRKYGGTGLGLAICKSLVEKMSGSIWLDSEPGKGSSFFFDTEFLLQSPEKERRLVPTPDLFGLKTLIVDDNSTSREILSELLQSFTFHPSAVQSGLEAIEELGIAARNKPYELVLIDWKMPGLNGIETVRLISQDSRLIGHKPKIIMLTAFDSSDVRRQAEGVKIDGFLGKPVNQSFLFDTIMNIFGKHASRVSDIVHADVVDQAALEGIRGATVLLVEDNAINQQVATEMLEGEGLRVTIAENGKKGVDLIGKEYFDLVLMDIQMPVMDGYEATRMIRDELGYKDLPVVAMTAHAMQGDRERCLEAGMDDYITKPIITQRLRTALVKWITPGDRGDVSEIKERPGHGADAADGASSIQLPGIDVDFALNRLHGNTELLNSILKMFYQENRETALRLKQTLDAGDLEQAARIVHTLKGASGNIGAHQLYTDSVELEAAIKKEKMNAISELLYNFESGMEHLLQGIAAHIEETRTEESKQPVDGPPQEIDRLKVEACIKELHGYLVEGNLKAEDSYRALRVLVGNRHHEKMNKLEEEISMFEMEGAQALLIELAADLGIELDP